MSAQCWDVFTSEMASGSLWAGVQLAQQLGRAGESVRLYVDDLALLVTQVNGIERTDDKDEVWKGVEVLEFSAVTLRRPGDRVVRVWGAQPPNAYEHLLEAEGAESRLVELSAPDGDSLLGHRLHGALQDLQHQAWSVCDSKGLKGGALKPASATHRVHRLRDLFKARLELLTRYEVWSEAQQSSLFVYLSGEISFDPCPLVRTLRASQRPTVMWVEPGDAQLILSCAFGVPVTGRGAIQVGELTLVFLPTTSWAQQDEIMAAADLVISSDLSQCWRASCMGTPLLPVLPGGDLSEFMDWYCQGSIASPQVLLRHLCGRLQKYDGLVEAWHWYRSCLPDFEDHAQEVRQRIEDAPDILSLLLQGMHSVTPNCAAGSELHSARMARLS